MAGFHRARRSRATIYLRPVEDPRAFGLVETEADGGVRAFREKPQTPEEITTNTINAGIYLLDAALLERIPPGRVVSVEREFFPALVRDGIPIFGWIAETYWRDIGSPAAYHAAQLDLLAGRVRTPLAPPGREASGAWIGDTVRLDPRAEVCPPSVLGDAVEVAADARIGPRTVLGARCRIGERARIDPSVLWENVRIGPDSVLQDCVIGADATIGASVTIGPGVVLEAGAVVPDGARRP
jgi:mannose-1-phosphate guanylyltransferase